VCQDKSGRLGGVAGSVVLYVMDYKVIDKVKERLAYVLYKVIGNSRGRF
jgi:hypothetical protein